MSIDSKQIPAIYCNPAVYYKMAATNQQSKAKQADSVCYTAQSFQLYKKPITSIAYTDAIVQTANYPIKAFRCHPSDPAECLGGAPRCRKDEQGCSIGPQQLGSQAHSNQWQMLIQLRNIQSLQQSTEHRSNCTNVQAFQNYKQQASDNRRHESSRASSR